MVHDSRVSWKGEIMHRSIIYASYPLRIAGKLEPILEAGYIQSITGLTIIHMYMYLYGQISVFSWPELHIFWHLDGTGALTRKPT